MPFTIRQDIWDSLKPEYQDIMETAAEVAGKQNRILIQNETTDMVQKLEKEGMEIVYPDLTQFQEATKDVKDVFKDVYGKDVLDALNNLN